MCTLSVFWERWWIRSDLHTRPYTFELPLVCMQIQSNAAQLHILKDYITCFSNACAILLEKKGSYILHYSETELIPAFFGHFCIRILLKKVAKSDSARRKVSRFCQNVSVFGNSLFFCFHPHTHTHTPKSGYRAPPISHFMRVTTTNDGNARVQEINVGKCTSMLRPMEYIHLYMFHTFFKWHKIHMHVFS